MFSNNNLLYVKNGESTFIVVFGDSKRKITSSVKGVFFVWFVCFFVERHTNTDFLDYETSSEG